MQAVFFLIALCASVIGAISGIGGGIIIKPIMDSIGVLPISTINFLSGCTVLTMAVSTLIRNIRNLSNFNFSVSIYLAIGAAFGGVIGKYFFSIIPFNIGLVQSIMLLIINISVFLYIKNRAKISTKSIKNSIGCASIGLVLGLVSSFLGIGGGPINIAVLYYFFSMEPKQTALNSLFIILFSQTTSLISTIATNQIPQFSWITLVVMCMGGVFGAIIGGFISHKVDNKAIEKLFQYTLVGLMVLGCYNIYVAIMQGYK